MVACAKSKYPGLSLTIALGLLVATMAACDREPSSNQPAGRKGELKGSPISMKTIHARYGSTSDDWRSFLSCWRVHVDERLATRRGYTGLDRLPSNANRLPEGSHSVNGKVELLQSRLGVQLPKSYRDYLAAAQGGEWVVEAFAGFDAEGKLDGGLSAIERVGAFAEVDQPNLDRWIKGSVGLPAVPPQRYFRYEYSENVAEQQSFTAFDAEKLKSAIKIGELDRGTVLLLNPIDVTADGEMEAWVLSFQTHARRFRSFAELMQYLASVDLLLDRAASPFSHPVPYRGIPCVHHLRTPMSLPPAQR